MELFSSEGGCNWSKQKVKQKVTAVLKITKYFFLNKKYNVAYTAFFFWSLESFKSATLYEFNRREKEGKTNGENPLTAYIAPSIRVDVRN